jgi:hypothetical protein
MAWDSQQGFYPRIITASLEEIMKRFAITAALGLCFSFLSYSAFATTYSIVTMNITNGGVTVDGFPDGFVPFYYLGPNTNLVGGYIGSGGGSRPITDYDPNGIAAFNWYGFPVSLYTAATNLGYNNSPPGSVTGGSIPSGILDNVAGTITMDLSSLFGTWNDGDYITGTGRSDGVTSAMANGTWNPTTYAYTLYWDARTIGPSCPTPNGCISHWILEGTASPVPVPAALWLFGSGMLSLIGLQWHRKSRK